MAVRKKGNKWYCRFQIDGVRYERTCKGATTQREAEKCEAVIKGEFMQGNYNFASSRQKFLFKDALELFENYSKGNKLSYKADISYLKKIRKYFGNNKPVEDITPNDIEAFRKSIKYKKIKVKAKELNPKYKLNGCRKKWIYLEKEEMVELTNSTINRHTEVLSKLFNLCIMNKHIKDNPCKAVNKLRQDNFKIRFLSKEEQRLLYKNINDEYLKNIVTIALMTGMRRGEIFSLKWDDITKNHIEVLNTKSGKARKIPLSKKLSELLDNIPKDSEYVFTNPKTSTKFVDIKTQFNNALKNANIINFRFHDLRHTAATRMVEKKNDLVVVKEIMGHEDIKTTLRYAHALEEMKQKAVDGLGDYF